MQSLHEALLVCSSSGMPVIMFEPIGIGIMLSRPNTRIDQPKERSPRSARILPSGTSEASPQRVSTASSARDIGRRAVTEGSAKKNSAHSGSPRRRSEEHTSELQSLMRSSYA